MPPPLVRSRRRGDILVKRGAGTQSPKCTFSNSFAVQRGASGEIVKAAGCFLGNKQVLTAAKSRVLTIHLK